MPTKPIGPPSDTAAPVASDALKNASAARARRRRRGRRPRPRRGQQVERARQHGEDRERGDEQRQRRHERAVAADVEIAHQPAHRAERLREVGQVLDEENQRREERVQRDARQQQHVGRETAAAAPRPASRRWRSPRATPTKLAIGTDETPSAPSVEAERDRQHRAQRGARRDAQRERRGQRVAEQRLQHDARRGQRAPTSAAASTRGSRATKKICASTLSAHGIDGSKTRAADRWTCCRASAPARSRPAAPTAPKRADDGRAVAGAGSWSGRRPAPARRSGGRWRRARARRRRRRRARGRASRVSTSAVGPAATTRPWRSSTSVAADRRRPGSGRASRRPSSRRASRFSVGEQRRDLELIAQIERRGRLVEQQHVGGLRQRRGDDDALLLAAAQRAKRAVLELRRAGRRQRVARDGAGRPGPRPRTRRDAGSGPSAPSRAPCSRRPAAVSCGTTAIRRASARREYAGSGAAVEQHLPAGRAARAGQQPQQRRLARAVRARACRRRRPPAPRADTPSSTAADRVVP